MSDLIDSLGELLEKELGVRYAGQEPQDKSDLDGQLVVLERIGGTGEALGRSDHPWIQFTALAHTKKRASDLLRDVRALVLRPRTKLGPFFIYTVGEALAPENATAQRDPFYRYRTTFEFHVKGLA